MEERGRERGRERDRERERERICCLKFQHPKSANSTFSFLSIPDFHDAVFVVGALDETLMLRGMRYHPIDIENSVMRAHKRIAER